MTTVARNRLAWLVAGVAFTLMSLLEERLFMMPQGTTEQWLYFSILVTCLSLPLLASHVAVGTIAVVGGLIGMLLVENSLPGGAQLAAILALYMAGWKLARPQAHHVRLGVLIPFALVYIYFLTTGRNTLSDVVIFMAFGAAAYFIGEVVFKKDLVELRLAEQNLLLIEQRELMTQRALTEERSRIGRELHDILAHTVSLMVIQAGAARKVLRADIEKTEAALDAVETSGRNALRDMRTIVARMKTGNDLDLAPTLASLEQLVQNTEAAGLPVEFDVTPDLEAVPEPLQLTVYRIVQESLTNALKHGGAGGSATVTVQHVGRGIFVTVQNIAGTGSATFSTEGGHGLAGMGERVHVFGGTLETGPTPDGFLVEAHLPI